MERGAIRIDVGCLRMRDYALAFIRMAEMREDDSDFREADGYFVNQARQSAGERRLPHEGGAGMQQTR